MIRTSAAPGRPVQLNFVDLTHRYGVYLGVLVTDEELVGGSAEAPVFLPRVGTVRKDRLAVLTEIDEAVAAMLGRCPEELVGRRSLEIIHPDDHQRAIGHWMDMLTRRAGARQRVRLRHQHADGRWIWFEVTNDSRLDEPGHGYVLTEMVDISEEMAAQDALRASEQLLRTLTESLPVGVLQVDALRWVVHRNGRLVDFLSADADDDGAGDADPDALEAQFTAVNQAGWCSSTWTGSRTLTTGAGTRPGTGCWRTRPPGWSPLPATATWWAGSAATSSW